MNGSTRGFHNRPMTGNEFSARRVSTHNDKMVTPSHVPTRCRRAMAPIKPIAANTKMMRSNVTSRLKNIFQYESLAPSGRLPYFMSVMYGVPRTKGMIQNAESSAAGNSVVTPYLKRSQSSEINHIRPTATTTKMATMP
ncbi:unannotated protein [freshwater metagenome]|uniref:Unannotated protein n=1 Tax=freshwater metagenome TaxID=449393 RepID=A0A6J7EJQ7_9ZZZZ